MGPVNVLPEICGQNTTFGPPAEPGPLVIRPVLRPFQCAQNMYARWYATAATG